MLVMTNSVHKVAAMVPDNIDVVSRAASCTDDYDGWGWLWVDFAFVGG